MQVRIYRNLTRDCLSVQAQIPGKGWRVIAHARTAIVVGATFAVNQRARRKVVETGRKTVHAWITGRLTAWTGHMLPDHIGTRASEILALPHAYRHPDLRGFHAITYNPRKGETFHTVGTQERVDSAERVVVTTKTIDAYAPRDNEGIEA